MKLMLAGAAVATAALLAVAFASDQKAPTFDTRLAGLAGLENLAPMSAPLRPAPIQNAAPAPLSGGPLCAQRSALLTYLKREYRERPIAAWRIGTNVMMTLLGSDDGTTWSLLLSAPDGNACLAGNGLDWRPLMPREQGT